MKRRSIIVLNLLMLLIILLLHTVVMTAVYHGLRRVAAESSLGASVGYNIFTLSYPIRTEQEGVLTSAQIFDLTFPFLILSMLINAFLFIKEER